MSTRYVWGRYEKSTVSIAEKESSVLVPDQRGQFVVGADGFNLDSGKTLYYAVLDALPDPGDVIELSSSTNSFAQIYTSPGDYVVFNDSNSFTFSSNVTLYYCPDTQGRAFEISPYDYFEWEIRVYDSTIYREKYGRTTEEVKGSFLDYVSGISQSSYPSDGVRGSYWYTYQGSDNIDPASVSIPSTINGGTAIAITVTPGSGKVYGGTVSYIYQVSLAGGAWTTIATTTATSRSYTVPYGTASIQVRVQAKDNLGFTSTTYVTSSSVNVINNQPPTAPGSINVTGAVAGQQATITLTAATDPDGTIASYIYERRVDGSAWMQIANVNSLTQTDAISADWGTVAYRACAVDDDGDSGPYVTSSTTVVNSGWVIISGPASDMGSQPKPFTFTITPSISGTTTSDQITVDVTLDGNSIYNEAVAPGTEIELEIDTRLMRTGDHAISVSATCASFLPAANEYSFTVPVITIPDGGRMDQLEGPDGQVIFPITLARAVAGLENYSVESKVHPGAYTGSGTYGSGNPNSLTLEFEPKMVIVQGTSGRMAVMIKPSGVGISIGASDSTTLNVTWDGDSVRWYNAVNAANQMNTNNETYSYTAFG